MKNLSDAISDKTIFSLLENEDWLNINFKELLYLKEADKGHKNNYLHTLNVLRNVMAISNDIRLYYVALFHDLGKHKTKKFSQKNGWEFHGHEQVSAKMLKDLYKRFDIDISTYDFVYNIVLYHGESRNVFGETPTDSAIRRIYRNLTENYKGDPMDIVNGFVIFSKCDVTSKNNTLKERIHKNADIFLERLKNILAEEEKRNKKYSVNGNDIMETFGVKQGRDLGLVLSYIKKSIDDGKLEDKKDVVIEHVKEIFFR